jgi:predicted nucleic acid-binding protein
MTSICYIDTNIFLNVIYDETPFAGGSRSLLERIQAGRLLGITSSVTETEVALDLASTGNRDKIDDALRLIEGMENLTICPLGSYVARLAVKLVLDSGLGLHDAYHSATAVENKAGIFVTRDKSLRSKLKKTINASEPESIPKGS